MKRRKPKRKETSRRHRRVRLIVDLRNPDHVVLDLVEVPLTPSEFALILELAKRSGNVVRREQIYRALWPLKSAEYQQIYRLVHQLREVFDEAGECAGRLLVVIHGVGYLLDLSPREVVILPFEEDPPRSTEEVSESNA